MRKPVMLALAAALCVAGAAQAEEDPLLQPVTATLITEHASVQPGGTTRVGVLFELEDGWHIYAREPGDAGLPTTIGWTVPAGATVGPLVWPPAQEFTDPGEIHTFGYSGTVVLASPLTVSGKTPLSAVSVAAKVRWLACREICLPGSAQLALSLPVMATAPVASTHAELFEHIDE